MNITNKKRVKVNSLYPSSRRSLYKLHCHCCDRPILRGQYITRCWDSGNYGVRLRPRATSNGSTYILVTGDRWVHRDCNPGFWTEYMAELQAEEDNIALEQQHSQGSTYYDEYGYNDYNEWE